MRNRTYYKNILGEVYSVSPRIVSLGVPPLDGFIEMDEEEKESYLNKLFPQNVTVKEETVDSLDQSTPVSLTPAQRRRELHRERRAAKAAKVKEFEQQEVEKNNFFEEISEDEIVLMDLLQSQGLNMDQIRNILVAKRAKKEE